MLICEAVEPDGKTCRVCEQYKSLDEYYPTKKGKYGVDSYCKPCKADVQLKWSLNKLYGVSMEQWNRLWENQDGRCSGCLTKLTRGNGAAALDHCHATGTVRGILCGGCNKLLGFARDSAATLRRLATYLEAHSVQP